MLGCHRAGDASSAPPDAGDGAASELRVVTLAPHLAEIVFAVGAGDSLVGVSAYTDYPDAAASLPLIGDAFIVDQEQLTMLRPGLLLAWESGTPAHIVDELRGRGFNIETIRTRGLADIALALEQVGAVTGHASEGAEAAAAFRDGLAALADRHAGAAPIRVFYQISSRPLYTVNGNHFVSELIELCGGMNIFDDLNDIAPLVSVEAVLARDPEVMLAAGDGGENVFVNWQRWAAMPANQYGNYFFLNAAEIGRATPRLLNAGETLCRALDNARRNRSMAVAAN
jgi:iron complex transport system substrate-binding protein